MRDCVRLGVQLTAVAVGDDGTLVAAGQLKGLKDGGGGGKGGKRSGGGGGGSKDGGGGRGGTMGGRTTMFNSNGAGAKGGSKDGASARRVSSALGGAAAKGTLGFPGMDHGGDGGGAGHALGSAASSVCAWRDGAIDDATALEDFAIAGHGVCTLLAIAPEQAHGSSTGARKKPRALTGGSLTGSLLLYEVSGLA